MSMEEKFVKIVIDLPDAPLGVGGESVWSVQVGDDLYEVRNTPWYAEDINFMDVVRAIAPAEDMKPVVKEIVHRGGHRTIRIIFFDGGAAEKHSVLAKTKHLGANFENCNDTMYGLDLKPEVDFDAIADYLDECEARGWLNYSHAPQPQPMGTGDKVQ